MTVVIAGQKRKHDSGWLDAWDNKRLRMALSLTCSDNLGNKACHRRSRTTVDCQYPLYICDEWKKGNCDKRPIHDNMVHIKGTCRLEQKEEGSCLGNCEFVHDNMDLRKVNSNERILLAERNELWAEWRHDQALSRPRRRRR